MPPARRAPSDPTRAAAALAALLAAVALQHLDALRVPLVGDDYFFIEKAERHSFAALWAPRELVSNFYRPWARELHFAWLHRVAGLDPLPFHLANLTLAALVAALYFALVRRLAGTAQAVAATAAVTALAAFGLLVAWASGAQDLWWMVAALAALHAWLSGRPLLAAGAYAVALLSKETAAVLPLVLIATDRLLRRRPWRTVARDIAPVLIVTAVWALVHPRLGGRWWYAHAFAVAPVARPPAGQVIGGTLLSLVQLDAWPRPEHGWGAALARAAPAMAALLVALAIGAWPRAPATTSRVDRAGVALFGACWALAGWLPLAMPGIGWHAYYGLFGALGAWLAVTALAGPRVVGATALALALLGAARAGTPNDDWGTEWFQRRAAAFIDLTHQQLRALHPTLPRGAQLYFTDVPTGIGLVPGGDDSPTLRVWYGDPTLRAAFLSRYPLPGADRARTLFFRFDPAGGWVEMVRGKEDLAAARRADPRWHANHEALARALLDGGDVAGAREEFAKLVLDTPDDPDDQLALALCACQLGDRAAAEAGFAHVLALPHATPQVQEEARRGCP